MASCPKAGFRLISSQLFVKKLCATHKHKKCAFIFPQVCHCIVVPLFRPSALIVNLVYRHLFQGYPTFFLLLYSPTSSSLSCFIEECESSWLLLLLLLLPPKCSSTVIVFATEYHTHAHKGNHCDNASAAAVVAVSAFFNSTTVCIKNQSLENERE